MTSGERIAKNIRLFDLCAALSEKAVSCGGTYAEIATELIALLWIVKDSDND